MNLPDYIDLIVQWSKDRKIIPNSTPDAQWLKGLSEIGELADAIAKGDRAEVIDSTGDVWVCMVNVYALRNDMPTLYAAISEMEVYGHELPAHEVTAHLTGSWAAFYFDGEDGHHYDIVNALAAIAAMYDTTLLDCVAAAYEQIKDRRGTLLPNGVFVKEE